MLDWLALVSKHCNLALQIKKSSTVIPRNSHIEANQSGLIAEPLIDITPQLPIPDYKVSSTRIACSHSARCTASMKPDTEQHAVHMPSKI